MGICEACGQLIEGSIHLRSDRHLPGCPWNYPMGNTANHADRMWVRGQRDAQTGRLRPSLNASYRLGVLRFTQTGRISGHAVYVPPAGPFSRFGYR